MATPFKRFRQTNDLLQKDVAQFLGKSVQFVSMVERGDAKLPGRLLAKLLDNELGWDTTDLLAENNAPIGTATIENGQQINSEHIDHVTYTGKSDAEIEQLIRLATAELEANNRELRGKLQIMSNEIAFYRSLLAGNHTFINPAPHEALEGYIEVQQPKQ